VRNNPVLAQEPTGNTKGQFEMFNFRWARYQSPPQLVAEVRGAYACWRSRRAWSASSACVADVLLPGGEWPGSGAVEFFSALPLRDPRPAGLSAAGPGGESCAGEPPGKPAELLAVSPKGTVPGAGKAHRSSGSAGLGELEDEPGGDALALGPVRSRRILLRRGEPELAARSDELVGDQ